jgi:hypothetical protein
LTSPALETDQPLSSPADSLINRMLCSANKTTPILLIYQTLPMA